MYPVLDQYQKEGYHALMKIAAQYGGAFLCDGVGLGQDLRRPDADRAPGRARPQASGPVRPQGGPVRCLGAGHPALSPLSGRRLQQPGHLQPHRPAARRGISQYRLDRVKEMADVIVIDEAHHFRNPGVKGEPGRYPVPLLAALRHLPKGKTIYYADRHAGQQPPDRLPAHDRAVLPPARPDHFKDAPLGIHSLPGHFRKLEKALEKMVRDTAESERRSTSTTNQAEAEQVLWSDDLFRALVVQRSRAYVKQSQEQHGGVKAIFPETGAAACGRLSAPQDLRPAARHGGEGLRERKAAVLPGHLLPLGLLHRPGHGETGEGLAGEPPEGGCQPDPHPVSQAL